MAKDLKDVKDPRDEEDWRKGTGAAGGGLPPRWGGSELGEGVLDGDLAGVTEGQAAGGVEELRRSPEVTHLCSSEVIRLRIRE